MQRNWVDQSLGIKGAKWSRRSKALVMLASVLLMSTALMLRVGSQDAPTYAGELPSDMPSLFVDPEFAYGSVGTTFNVSVKIFNLTNSFYTTDERWEPGQALGPPHGFIYNYSLGNLYGFNITFRWDSTVLQYLRRTVKTPVEDYPEGVLHGLILESQDEVNATTGTYTLAQLSWPPVAAFNCPNGSATIFTITFKIKADQVASMSLEHVELILDPNLAIKPHIPEEIPHWIINGTFTPIETTRITRLNAGTPVNQDLQNPIIFGETAHFEILVENMGRRLNSYNLTAYIDYSTPLISWKNERLDPGEKRTYNCTLESDQLGSGVHTVTATAIIEAVTTILEDSITKNFTIVRTPLLRITTPSNNVHENDTVTLSGENCIHRDQNGQILNFTWFISESLENQPTFKYEGIIATHTFTKNGTWHIALEVTDNWGVTYDSQRNSTTPYRAETTLTVHALDGSSGDFTLTYVHMTTIIVLLILMALIWILTQRRKQTQDY